MPNFLEQLVAEWDEFGGYFVRRNIRVGKRHGGGYEGELDVVAFHPQRKHLVHIEPSMDADGWEKREHRFKQKFNAGRRYIPTLFESFGDLPEIEQVGLFVVGSGKTHQRIGGGTLLHITDFMNQIKVDVGKRKVSREAIPEQFVILKALRFAANFWT